MTTPIDPQLNDSDLELLSAYIDSQLSPGERVELEARLEREPALHLALDELRATVGLLRRLEPLTPPRSFTLGQTAIMPRRRLAIPWMSLGSAVVVLACIATFTFVLFRGGRGFPSASAPEVGFAPTAAMAPAGGAAQAPAATAPAAAPLAAEAPMTAAAAAEPTAAAANELPPGAGHAGIAADQQATLEALIVAPSPAAAQPLPGTAAASAATVAPAATSAPAATAAPAATTAPESTQPPPETAPPPATPTAEGTQPPATPEAAIVAQPSLEPAPPTLRQSEQDAAPIATSGSTSPGTLILPAPQPGSPGLQARQGGSPFRTIAIGLGVLLVVVLGILALRARRGR